jgi:hypothetical protein
MKMKKKLVTVLSLALVCVLGLFGCTTPGGTPAGDEYGFTVKIVDSSGNPITGANVKLYVKGTTIENKTPPAANADGSLVYSGITGEVVIKAIKEGFTFTDLNVDKSKNGNTLNLVGAPDAHVPTGTKIDMYLIAGQSNAEGNSTLSSTAGGLDTFPAMRYAGQVNRNIATDNPSIKWSDFIKNGLGLQSGYIGPEFGMAKYFTEADKYTAENKGFIFKSARGDTALRNVIESNGSTLGGNWYPPSQWKESDVIKAQRGKQYDYFIENFTTVYNTLKEEGFDPVVKGFVWVQGEADRQDPTLYKTLMRAFINDIRADLQAITGQNCERLPFVLGGISPTFNALADKPVNDAFNAALQALAASPTMVNVYTIQNDDLNCFAANGTIIGTDAWHYNGADMITFGKRCAETFLTAAHAGWTA